MIKLLLSFSLPIIIGQLGIVLIGATDIWMAARHSPLSVASIGLANSLLSPLLMLGIGMNAGIAPKLSQLKGAGEKIDQYFGTYLLYSFLWAIPGVILTIALYFLCPYLSFKKELVAPIQDYIKITGPSLLFISLYSGIKEYLQAREKITLANLLAILAIFLNIFLNYLFVFVFSLEIKGFALSTLFVRVFLFLGVFIPAIYNKNKNKIKNRNRNRISKEIIYSISIFSLPLSLGILAEVLAFSCMAPLIGQMDTLHTAAHNIALTISSTFFMIPMGISSAMATLIGKYWGEKNLTLVNLCSKVGVSISFFLGLFFTLLTFLFLPILKNWVTQDFALQEILSTLFIPMSALIVFDFLQVTFAGILRGIGKTRPIFYSNTLFHWGLGLPLGLWLAHSFALYSIGMWIGISLSLLGVCAYLAIEVKRSLINVKI